MKPGETSVDVARRNVEIVTASQRGMSPATIANTYGLDVDHVRRIIRENKDLREPLNMEGDPVELARDQLDQLAAAIDELAIVSATAKNDSARVGAIGKRLDAIRQQRELLQAIGLLPHDLGTLHVSIDVQAMSIRVLEVFERFDLPMDVQGAIIDAIDPPQRPALPAAPAPEVIEAKPKKRSRKATAKK